MAPMRDQPRLAIGSARLQLLFEASLQEYEKQTDIALAKHPLAEQVLHCDFVESITAILQEQVRTRSEFQGSDSDRIIMLLNSVVSDLYSGVRLGLPPHFAKPICAGLAILLATVKDVGAHGPLVDLLESIESFLKHLDIYTKIRPTIAMTDIVVKTLGELLFILALATKLVKKGRPEKLSRRKDVDAVLQRLDRLTQDEARITAAQILEVVYGLAQTVRVVMDDGKPSVNHVWGALETMQQVVSDKNKLKCDKLERRVRSWLSPPDPLKNHSTACKSRHRRSAAWFVQGNAFSEWKASEARSSLLLVYGKPGAGKSVLCSTIIKDIDAMRKAGLASLAFFYCDFKEDQKKNLRGLLSSLLVQLCCQSDSYCDMLFEFYLEHAEGSHHPSDDALARCLKNLLKLPGLAPIYLIVDALDEFPITSPVRSPRVEVLNLIEELIKTQFPNPRLCVTSRPETDIMDVLRPFIFRSVSLDGESRQKRDIEDYIKSIINTHPKNRRWKEEHKQRVIDVLTEKARMFRWAHCQVVYICGCIPERIPHALADLPETLDEIYLRTLREINDATWEIAHRLFQFVAVASRALRIEELAELLAFDFKARPIPKFHEGWRLEDPVDAVLSSCSSLLAIVGSGCCSGKVVRFSHISVKEFLMSARLAGSSDTILRRYHVSMTPAHTIAAQACLGILLHLDMDFITITSNLPEEYPLAEYAAEHWASHARFTDVSQNVENGMKQLFDPRKPHLAVCVWIHDPEVHTRRRTERAESPLPLTGTPLHYAALWGLPTIVEFLVIEHSQDVLSRGFTRSATPLHLASRKGQLEVASILIERGADVTAQNEDEETPLHLASQEGQVEVAGILIEHGADVAAQNEDRETPLHLASRNGQLEVVGMLIERGADVAAKNSYRETPLHLASRNGQLEVVDMLVECGAYITAQNEDEETPLHLALQEGHAEVAGMLIERGANVTAKTYKAGETPLHLALRKGQLEVIGMLIERGAHLTTPNRYGETPLYLALERRQFEVACILIERGADMTTRNKDGETLLHLTLQEGHVEFARMLIDHGVDVTARNKYLVTPLHLASWNRQRELVGELIRRGADVTAQDKIGSTPLHWASSAGDTKIARYLFKRGSNTDARDNDNCTPLHYASQQGHSEVVRFLVEKRVKADARDNDNRTPLHCASQQGHLEVVRFFLEHGIDAYARDNDNNTPLHCASQQGHLEVARVLVQHGIDVNARDHSDWTPLHGASRYGQLKVVRFLLEHGADARALDQGGWTSLQWPSYNGYPEIVRALLEHGADANTRDNSHWTPLHGASQEGHEEVAQVLLEHGADANSCDDSNQTPLHLASRAGHFGLVQLLIESKANVDVRNNEGRTPLEEALSKGLHDVKHSLLSLLGYEGEEYGV